MAKIKIHFSHSFRHMARKDGEEIDLAETTLEGLVQALERSYGRRFTRLLRDSQKQLNPGITILVNGEEFPGWQAALCEGDEVSFLLFMVGG